MCGWHLWRGRFKIAIPATIAVGLLLAVPAASQGNDLLALLPPTSVAVAGIQRTDEILDNLLRPELRALAGVARNARGKEIRRAEEVLERLAAECGTDGAALIARLTAHGACISADVSTFSAIALFASRNAELAARFRAAVCKLLEEEAQRQGRGSPVQEFSHREIAYWRMNPNAWMGVIDRVLVVSTREQGIQAVIDRHTNRDLESLATADSFAPLREALDHDTLIWGAGNLAAVRFLPQFDAVLRQPGDNPLAELLLGGVVDCLARSPGVVATLNEDAGTVTLKLSLAAGSSEAAQKRAWFFAGDAPPASLGMSLPGGIVSLSLARDASGMWRYRDELFNERTNSQLTQADSNLGLYFSGRDFGPEVLGRLGTGWRIVAARRTFRSGEPVPAVKLPTLAAVVELDDPDFADPLLLAWQNIIGIINIQGIQSGSPQLLIGTSQHGSTTLYTTRFALPEVAPTEGLPLAYNFTPACAVVDRNFVVGTTADVVRQLVDRLEKPATHHRPQPIGLDLLVDPDTVVDALDDNRELLLGRVMIARGQSREEANRMLDDIFAAVRRLRTARLALGSTTDRTTLTLSVSWE